MSILNILTLNYYITNKIIILQIENITYYGRTNNTYKSSYYIV